MRNKAKVLETLTYFDWTEESDRHVDGTRGKNKNTLSGRKLVTERETRFNSHTNNMNNTYGRTFLDCLCKVGAWDTRSTEEAERFPVNIDKTSPANNLSERQTTFIRLTGYIRVVRTCPVQNVAQTSFRAAPLEQPSGQTQEIIENNHNQILVQAKQRGKGF